MSNLYRTNIVWQTENFECLISAMKTLEEAKGGVSQWFFYLEDG